MSLLGFGLRDIILVLAVLAAIYLVVLLLRLVQLGRRRPHETAITASAGKSGSETSVHRSATPEWSAPSVGSDQTDAAKLNAPRWQSDAVKDSVEGRSAAPPAPASEWEEFGEAFGGEAKPSGARRPGGGFGEPLANHLVRSEMEMELQRMRDEMARMRTELEALRSARHVSPHYAEAMELAKRGATAQEIADQLGISQAEAELVQALSRGRRDFAEGDGDGADPYADGSREFDEFARRRVG